MRNAPLSLSRQLVNRMEAGSDHPFPRPDLVFCSEMLDLAQWRGFISGQAGISRADSPELAETLFKICALPTICYFHENQWTYPISPHARVDAHYGYTNLLTALAADEVWFNSKFHQDEFLNASSEFVARMPDERSTHDLDQLGSRSRVVPPGYQPVPLDDEREATALEVGNSNTQSPDRPVRIGWAARWEHDKRPDRFEQLLGLVEQQGVPFELILLGSRPLKPPAALASIEKRWSQQIRINAYAESKNEYHRWLREMDVVVSTADHEFFGIAICEAISAGALPVLPDALNYPELVEPTYRYLSLSEAAQSIAKWAKAPNRRELAVACRARLLPLAWDRVIDTIDDGIERVAGRND